MYLVCRLLLAQLPPAFPPLSLHDALPISVDLDERSAGERAFVVDVRRQQLLAGPRFAGEQNARVGPGHPRRLLQRMQEGGAGANEPRSLADRKSTRLNSSHRCISYAVFCLPSYPPRSPPFPYTTLFRSQLTLMNGPPANGLSLWMCAASSSLPVPDSPASKTRASDLATRDACCSACRKAGLVPMSRGPSQIGRAHV